LAGALEEVGPLMRLGIRTAALCFCVVALAACGNPSKQDMDELRNQQRQILAKLGDIEKKLEGGAGREAREPREPRGRTGPDPEKVHEIPVGKSPVKGPEAAPVTIVEFSDYQCPFCSRADPMIEEVIKAYPTQVRLVYKNLPLISIHPFALGAAQAAVAAQKQGKFWEMHDLLFSNQRALQPEKLKEYATQLGLDAAKFEADMNSDETKSAIQEDMRLAQTVGVRGTPTMFVNGKLVVNRSVDGFKQTVDAALKEKPKG
jgi:protein-disulfide isomerase